MIYCNVSECSNWKALDAPVPQKKSPGFVPLFEVLYKGTCKSKVMKVNRSTSVSNSVRKLVHSCASYNTTFEEGSGIVCTEDRCLYNNYSEGCTKENIYVDMEPVHDGVARVDTPVCKSFGNRRHAGHYDWRRIAEGGYGPVSNAPY